MPRLPALAAIAVLLASPLHAQPGLPADAPPRRPSASGEVAGAAVNAALGGVTAGVLQHLRGGSFRRGFAAGAAGGAVAYAGRRVAVERFEGAGLLGRELHAVGASMVANAGEGRGALARVALPLGPVRLHLGAGERPRVALDLAAGAALAHTALRTEMRIEWGRSLSAGAPVFHSRGRSEGREAEGRHAAGVVWIVADESEWNTSSPRVATALAHERVHVLQHDFALAVWSAPAQRAVAPHLRLPRAVDAHLELGLHFPAWRAANAVIPYERRPWEREAFFLSGRTAGPPSGPVRLGP